MKTEIVRLRVSSEELEDIDKAAKRDGVSRSAMLRIFIHEGLSSYDVKHQQLLGYVEKIYNNVVRTLETAQLTALLAASGKDLDFEQRHERINTALELLESGWGAPLKIRNRPKK